MLDSIFNYTNLCRIIFYTPVIFLGSILSSVIYDYITFKEDEDNNKKLD